MNLRTPLKKAHGLGSAKDGTHHWWMQRLSAIALAPLGVWFVVSAIALVGASHAEAVAWISQPLTAVLLVLFVPVLLYHSMLGLQVVIEDYVHLEWLKFASLIVLKFAHYFIAAGVVFAVLRVALGG